MKKRIILICLVFLVLLPFLSMQVMAKPFYEGKTIKLIAATKPGGGYDFYARLIARFMKKYLLGSTIIVKNIPGAGHIIGCNTIYAAKSNGLTFGTFSRGLPLAQVAGLKGVKFDLSKMTWLGSPATGVFSLVMTKRFKNLDDLRKAEVVRIASGGVGNQNYIVLELFKEMTGMDNIKNSTGYSGTEAELAMMRGEVDGQWASWSSSLSFVRDGHGNFIVFNGNKQPKGYEGVPLLRDVVTEEEYKPVINLLRSVNLLSRPFAGPPGISKDRTKILRDAFAKACHDKELQKLGEKSNHPIDYVDGEEALRLIQDILHLPPKIIKILKQSY
ncbi:Bug family tripartite tricarboxylate transporter substrate binding protein [Thermodesulfobacteriota bacterium]